MKNKTIIKSIFFFVIMLFIKLNASFAQNHAVAFAAADSNRFSVNNSGGWQFFNSYVSQVAADTVQFELIVQHTNNLNWSQEQYVGKIKHSQLLPNTEQSLPFNLSNDGYTLRIEKNGKCYLRFLSGTLPAANPVILPLKVFYKLL